MHFNQKLNLFTSVLVITLILLCAEGRRNVFIDLSHSFDNKTVVWPGTSYNISQTNELSGNGFTMYARSFCAPEHVSTHLDAPFHFNKDGRKLHEIPLENLLNVPAVKIDISNQVQSNVNYALLPNDVLGWEQLHGQILPGSVVLVHTGWGSRWGDEERYRGTQGGKPDLNFPGISGPAAKFLAFERGVIGVGVDTLSTDPGNSQTFEGHSTFASQNIYMLENVANTDKLPPRGFHLFIAPLKIEHGTGAPTRIFATID